MTEKQGQISGREFPNAAPRDRVDEARSRVEALGMGFHDGIKAAGLSRNTGFKLLRGEGSLGSIKKLEDWLSKEENKRPRKATTPESKSAEWATLGAKLQDLDPQRFEAMLVGLRELVRAKLQEEAAITMMFRPVPER